MKVRKTGFCASATDGSYSRPRVWRGSDTPRWVYAIIAGFCFCAENVCDAQIQVYAYIPSASVNVSNGQPTFNLGQVFVVDTATNQPVGSPISVGSLPAGVTVTPDGRYAYVTNNGSDTISVIDTASQTVVGSINVAPGPLGVAASPDASLVYATSPGMIFSNFDGNTVSVINKGTNALVSSLTSGAAPIGIVLTSDGARAYVANSGSNSVSVINTATNVIALSIPVGNSPTGVAISPNGQYVYVASQNQNNGGLPGTVSVISTATSSVVLSIPVGNSPTGVAISPNGQYVYVTNMNNNGSRGTVSVISTATNTVVATIPVGQSPIGVSVTPDGNYVYVSNSNIGSIGSTGPLVGNVSVISTATNTVVDSIHLGSVNLAFGSFISPNIIVAQGGPLLIGNDAALTPLGFQRFVDFNGGAIKLTGDWVTSRMVSLLSRGGTIDTNGFNANLSGEIINSGALTKIGAGMLTLSGENTYTGGTQIAGGILSVSNDRNLGTGSITISNNAELLTASAHFASTKAIALGAGGGTLAGVAGTDATYTGVISGSGRLSVGEAVNRGTIILSAANTFSGGTVLNAGTLVVDSAQALGLGDVVVRGGILRTDPQPINVKGNYSQSAGGTLQLSLAGGAEGQYDFLNVSGHASLSGTLQLISLNGFQPKISDKFTLVRAEGGVSGQFSTVIDQFSPLLSLDLIYGQNNLVLEVGTDFAAFAETFNELTVAKQLDKVALDPREANLITFLGNEPFVNLPEDFQKISPDSLSAIYEISFSAANIQAANLEERFAEIRSGSSGFSSSLSVSNVPETMVKGKDGKAMIEPGKNMITPSPENRWGTWISGNGDYVNVSGDGNGGRYDFTTGGVSLGLDYRLTQNLAVGVAGSYAHTWTNLTGSGKIDADSGRVGLYATYFRGGIYLSGYIGGGYNSYDTRRDTLGGAATGSTNGGEFDTYVGGGYEFHFGGFSFGPIALLQYTYLDLSGSNESGSLAPLRIQSKSEDSLRTNLGLCAAYTIKPGKVQLTPSVRASWQHECAYRALPITAQFDSETGNAFTVYGPAEGQDSAIVNAGINVQWRPTLGTYFGYNGQLGRDRFDSQGGVCNVRWDF